MSIPSAIFEVVRELWVNMQLFAWVFAFFGGFIVAYGAYAFGRWTWPIHDPERLRAMAASGDCSPLLRVQNSAHTLRFLNSLLPAIGLLGTLTGMYLGFNQFRAQVGAAEASLVDVMGRLMGNFAVALTTTLVGVLLRLVFDFLCHFLFDRPFLELRATVIGLKAGGAVAEEPDAGEAPATADTLPAPIPAGG